MQPASNKTQSMEPKANLIRSLKRKKKECNTLRLELANMKKDRDAFASCVITQSEAIACLTKQLEKPTKRVVVNEILENPPIIDRNSVSWSETPDNSDEIPENIDQRRKVKPANNSVQRKIVKIKQQLGVKNLASCQISVDKENNQSTKVGRPEPNGSRKPTVAVYTSPLKSVENFKKPKIQLFTYGRHNAKPTGLIAPRKIDKPAETPSANKIPAQNVKPTGLSTKSKPISFFPLFVKKNDTGPKPRLLFGSALPPNLADETTFGPGHFCLKNSSFDQGDRKFGTLLDPLTQTSEADLNDELDAFYAKSVPFQSAENKRHQSPDKNQQVVVDEGFSPELGPNHNFGQRKGGDEFILNFFHL